MTADRPSPYGRLCGNFASALAKAFHPEATSPEVMYVPYCDVGDFARLADALQTIDVVEERPNANGTTYPHFTMLPDQMLEFVGKTLGDDDPRIPNVISACINVACGYGLFRGSEPLRYPSSLESFVEYPRDFAPSWFPIDEHYRALMKSFVSVGFAEKKGGLFRWTRKMSEMLSQFDTLYRN